MTAISVTPLDFHVKHCLGCHRAMPSHHGHRRKKLVCRSCNCREYAEVSHLVAESLDIRNYMELP